MRDWSEYVIKNIMPFECLDFDIMVSVAQPKDLLVTYTTMEN